MNEGALGRVERLIEYLQTAELNGIAVTSGLNVRYLTGFTGSNGAVSVSTDGDLTLITDGRYADQAANEVSDSVTVEVKQNLLEELARRSAGRWAVETHVMSIDDYSSFEQMSSAELIGANRVVETLRESKDDSELAALREACEISTAALQWLTEQPLIGRSERQIARALENRMFDLGAEAIAFDTIVASGPNSAIPHHQPTTRELKTGELLKIDFGARVAGYHADCTRTFSAGPPADWQRDIHAAVHAAQSAGVQQCVAGRSLGDIDDAARWSLAQDNWDQYFTTGLGHGVGLAIHEDPFISTDRGGKLHDRCVLTVEPGIYLVGRGGVRIEDTVQVAGDQASGQADIFTAITTDLVEIA